jgi:serine/threonine protein kinase
MTFPESARRIGYEITGSPIRGGSGVIHRATDITTGKEVAIKALAPGFDLSRLEREARILARIDHPNVARLQGFEVIDGTASLIVDWVDGEPLTNVLRQNSHLSVRRSLDIFEQVANALDAVHRTGVGGTATSVRPTSWSAGMTGSRSSISD